MYGTRFFTLLLCLASVMFAGCEPDLEDKELGGGNLNLNKYVALGDSYTAGFANGGIYRAAQEVSYPAIIAAQMAKAGGSSTFVQPYFEGSGTGYTQLVTLPNTLQTIDPNPAVIRSEYANNACFPLGPDFYFHKADATVSSVNNLGVPFLRIGTLDLKNLGNSTTLPVTPPLLTEVIVNPYFERLLPGTNDTLSYVEAVYAANPTFYTAWFGMDDLVNYALSGGTCGTQPMPDTSVTTPVLKKLADSLAARGAKGAIGNLPRITDFPYFKLVDNLQLEARARTETNNPDAKVYINASQTLNSASDIVLFSALPGIGVEDANGNKHGFSPENPLTNAEVLTSVEIGRINSAISKYNAALSQFQLKRRHVTLVETSPFFTNLNSGILYSGVNYSTQYITGEAFSVDGLRLSPRGNALLANLFIQRINDVFGSFIPSVNPNNYPATQRP